MKIDNSKNPEMEVVHTDKMGNEWYAFINLLNISPSRGVSAARADRFTTLKISESNLKELVNTAINGINEKQDFVQAIAVLHEIKYRLEFLCEENSLLDLAAIYYFLKDEDPNFPSDLHNKKKIDIWSKDETCRSFFLLQALALTKQFSDTPETDLLLFLERTKTEAERIYRLIPRPQINNS